MQAYLGTIWHYRYFWLSLVRMDLRTRYRRSVLGIGWSLLQPLTMTCIFCLVFMHFVQAPIRDYAPHVLTGLVTWNFVLATAVHGCQCFFQGESYIRQCPLPLAIYPLRSALGAVFHLSMGLLVLTFMVCCFFGFPGILPLMSLLPSVIILFLFGWSMAVITGSANVYFQDTQHIAEVGFQIAFYLTPIIYRVEDLQTHKLGWLLQLNPLIPFMNLIRQPLLHQAVPTFGQYAIAGSVTCLAMAIAIRLLSKLQDKLIFHL